METVFSGEELGRWLDGMAAWLFGSVLTPENVVLTAMQVPALVGSGFAAWWIYDFVAPALAARILRSSMTDYAQRVWLTLAALIFPALWGAGLWIAVAVSDSFQWPYNILRVAINLLSAWTAIQLASILVRDKVWSRTIALIVYMAAALNILHLLRPLLDLLDRLAVTFGGLRLSVLTVVEGMLALGILLWMAVLSSRIIEKHVQMLPHLTPSMQVLVAKLLKATLVSLAVILALVAVGIDLTALAVVGGAIGLGVGFGLQKIAANLISGVILLMDRSIKPGDIIQIGETYGWVASLGARYVSIETRDGTEFLIPNEDIITHQVINWSHKNDLARLKVRVRVSYQSDVHKALTLLVEAACRPPRVLAIPEPKALLLTFAENGAELELRFWIRDVHNGIHNVSSDVMLVIWELFRTHGIVIPFPQRDIHIQSPLPATSARPVAVGPGPVGPGPVGPGSGGSASSDDQPSLPPVAASATS